MTEFTGVEKLLTIKSRAVRKALQGWLALSIFLSGCAPVLSKEKGGNGYESAINKYSHFYHAKDVGFIHDEVETKQKKINILVADNLPFDVDKEGLVKIYSFFERLNTNNLDYPIIQGGAESNVTITNTDIEKGSVIVLNKKDGLPDDVARLLGEYLLSGNYQDVGDIPAITITYDDKSFITFIRLDEDTPSQTIMAHEVAEACNASINLSVNKPYLHNFSLAQQEQFAKDVYCTAWALAGADRVFGLSHGNHLLLAEQYSPPKISIGDSVYAFNYPPIDKNSYDLLPDKPYISTKK